jgi:hypothetical protein
VRKLLAQYPRCASFERHRRRGVGRTDADEQVYMIRHDFLGHDLPAALGGDLLQQPATAGRYRPPKIRRRYFGHHTKCSPSEHTPPGVRRNRRSDMPQTLRDQTDKTNDPTLITNPDSQDG